MTKNVHQIQRLKRYKEITLKSRENYFFLEKPSETKN